MVFVQNITTLRFNYFSFNKIIFRKKSTKKINFQVCIYNLGEFYQQTLTPNRKFS